MSYTPGTRHSLIPTTTLSDEKRALVAEFVDERLRPVAAELDEAERLPKDIFTEMGKIGLFGFTVPADAGGVGGAASQVRGLVFDDVAIGPDALLGEEGKAFGYMMKVHCTATPASPRSMRAPAKCSGSSAARCSRERGREPAPSPLRF